MEVALCVPARKLVCPTATRPMAPKHLGTDQFQEVKLILPGGLGRESPPFSLFLEHEMGSQALGTGRGKEATFTPCGTY